MWNVANCWPSTSIGEISATNSSAIPVPHSTARPTGAARAPPWARARRHRTPYTAPYPISDAITTGAKVHEVSTDTSDDCDARGCEPSPAGLFSHSPHEVVTVASFLVTRPAG